MLFTSPKGISNNRILQIPTVDNVLHLDGISKDISAIYSKLQNFGESNRKNYHSLLAPCGTEDKQKYLQKKKLFRLQQYEKKSSGFLSRNKFHICNVNNPELG